MGDRVVVDVERLVEAGADDQVGAGVMDLAVWYSDRRPDLAGFAGRIRREDVRRVQMARLAVGAHAEGRDQVQTQEGQIGQVVLTQRFVAQMRMDEPNASERLPAEAIV